jgi:hypothetical protein
MQLKGRQRGMTFWGLLFVLSVIAIVVFLIFKLFPVYMGDFKVKAALDSLVKQQDVATMGKPEIITSLDRRFDVDDIRHVDLKRDLTIEQQGRNKVIRIRYEAVVPMVSNISALVEFDHSREVRGSAQ